MLNYSEKKRKLILGSLLHDLGKVLYRDYSVTNHSDMGYDYLVGELKLEDKDILDQVRYHHSNKIKGAKLDNASLAYITYIADNIASMSDRREEISNDKKDEKIFDKHIRLKSIFNKLNNNDAEKVYEFGTLDDKESFKIPINESKINHNIDDSFYGEIIENLHNGIGQIFDENRNINCEYINSFLEILEANLSFIPSSTDLNQVADISLYDHLKITCAYASCIYDYLDEKSISNYKDILYAHAKDFYNEEAFLFLNLDLSGIQDFIYTHSSDSKGMIKSLRTRSFYLEILLENIVDDILEKVELSRANVIYIGGGHAYMMLPNTEKTKNNIENMIKEINAWFFEKFDISLFLAYGYSVCSANALSGENEKSYSEIFHNAQINVSKIKMHKFSAEEITELNNMQDLRDGRECAVCKKTNQLVIEKERYLCKLCASIENISIQIFNKNFFAVVNNDDKENNNELNTLPLPFNKKLLFVNENEAKEIINSSAFVRLYSKNEHYTGKGLSKKINFADYYNKYLTTFPDLAKSSYGGYKKLAVFRADVDNLGETFIKGFKHEKYGTKLMTLSRNATFSRMMSLFFKKYINIILKNPIEYYVVSEEERKKISISVQNEKSDINIKGRDIAIIYSGGDDIFAVGAWDEIINFAIDLNEKFKEFSDNTLTFSCGIGIYDDSLPISFMARNTGELEDVSKSYMTYDNGIEHKKDAITIFDTPYGNEFANTYHFDEFIDEVLSNKYEIIKTYFNNSEEKGRSFLYKLIELVENSNDKINVARLAYVLARAKPNKNESNDENALSDEEYKEFSSKIIDWIQPKNNIKVDIKQLLTALKLYGYYSREEEKNNDF